jgi:hypothetical protein
LWREKCERKSAAEKSRQKKCGKKITAEKSEKSRQQHDWGLFMRDMAHLV